MTIPVAARLLGTAGSNPAGVMDVCVVCVVSTDERQDAGQSRQRTKYG